ncbi:spoIIIJ-associated protein [Lachnospiraceae bacterium C10]|jgi:spoIIIJ-associated protein|nr:spoIIIJ-associated protein [Lachnospiraceae bacterium C10]
MEFTEFTGKSVDDALTKASIQLGAASDQLDYEVIEAGSNGILGFGSRNAVIRARKKVEDPVIFETSTFEEPENKAVVDSDQTPSDIAKEFLADVFDKMGLEVSIDTTFDDIESVLSIELSGPEMGIIIGKRGQTLDSLQYLTNLAVNRKSTTYIRVKMDTEDYRRRRTATLENLAHNVAYKVKRTRRPAALEAMNPYERRIIHYALQDDDAVVTHSEGEEPYRHVVIALKRK